MRFEYPGFLFALFLLGIPVIIHLFNFRRYKKFYFSNVQFLKQVNEQQATGRNLKERLILLSRLLALCFLVLAFAKPYLANKGITAPGQTQLVSIFVDNSSSMQALGNEGSLLDEAKSKAKEIAAGFDPNTRFQLLTQDFFGKDQRLVDRAEFNNEIDGINFSSQSRSLNAILDRQQSLLDNAGNTAQKVYIISDFQLGMANGKSLEVKNNTGINLVQLKVNNLPNIAIDSVWFQGAVQRPGEVEKLIFKLHNYADEKAVNVPLKLFINDTQKALGSYTINANTSHIDTLSFSGLRPGWERAELRLQDNPVTFDNIFHFSFYVADQIPVLLINGGIPNPYLKAVFASEPFFKTTVTPYGNINYSSLQNYPLVVLSDTRSVSAGLAQQLRNYVRRGGNLAIFPEKDIDVTSYQTFLQGMGLAYFGKKVNDTTKVSGINLNAGIYKNTFESMPQNPDLPKVNAYYPLNTNAANSEKLMTLQNGNPFWEQFNYATGKVYLCAVPIDENFSNLPRHSLFVTTMLRMGLLSGHNQQLYNTLGQDKPVTINNVNQTAEEVLKLTNGSQQIIPDVRMRDGLTTLFLADQVTKPGTYKLLKKDSLIQLLSFNSDSKESDIHYYKPAELEKITGKNGHVFDPASAYLKNNVGNAGFGFQLWKLCLLLTLIFLGAEILLLRFYKIPKAITS